MRRGWALREWARLVAKLPAKLLPFVSVVDKVAAQSVRAERSVVERLAQFRFVFGMTG